MSEFHIEVIRLGPVRSHPNADTLSVTDVHGGYPVIFKTGEFKEGGLAVYVPVDSVVPTSGSFAFLQNPDKPSGTARIKAKKLRGVFSMGLLVPSKPEWTVGQDVRVALNVTQYEPPEPTAKDTENEKDPGFLPCYTDIEPLRRYAHLLQEGEPVIITEKLHGCNGRFLWNEDRLWVGSHNNIKRADPQNLWWRVAHKYHLVDRLCERPGVALYGEVYGQVMDLKYGVKQGEVKLAFFDALDIKTRKYLDAQAFFDLVASLGLDNVPVLYQGPWSMVCMQHAEGQSKLAEHVREGFVVRPLVERYHEEVGRMILKIHGEGYHLRKEKK